MVVEYLPLLLRGAAVTLQLTLFSALASLPIAFALGLGRLSRIRPLQWVSGVVLETVRGTSLLVQLFWFYYVLPLFNINLPQMTVAIVALALNTGAYGAEIVRSSIQAIPKGQIEAAIALNMTPLQRMRRIVLPQAFVMMLREVRKKAHDFSRGMNCDMGRLQYIYAKYIIRTWVRIDGPPVTRQCITLATI